jgi:biopolymer transport protein ExbD
LLEEKQKTGETLTLLIKPDEKSVYKDLVDVLDELSICGIGIYALMEPEKEDKAFVNTFVR